MAKDPRKGSWPPEQPPLPEASGVETPSGATQAPEVVVSHDQLGAKRQVKEPGDSLVEEAWEHWRLGNWGALAAFEMEQIEGSARRAELALLAAAGLQLTERFGEARRFAQQALVWGCAERVVKQVLVGGLYHALGQMASVAGYRHRALRHFESAVLTDACPGDVAGVLETRVNNAFRHLGIPVSMRAMEGDANVRPSASAADRGYFLVPTSRPTRGEGEFLSSAYWDERYQAGGTSGYGSYGRLAEFKADVINDFVVAHGIGRLIEFGSGDGHQLSKLCVPEYIGIDVSPVVVEQCRQRFKEDKGKKFYTRDDFLDNPQRADLTLSLDVIFHLTEDSVFEQYMDTLFESSRKYCIIYSCNEDRLVTDAIHVRRRKFTEWVVKAFPEWRLVDIKINKYPHDGSGNPKDASFSNFYFYERVSGD